MYPQLLAVTFAWILYKITSRYSLFLALLSCIPSVTIYFLLYCLSVSVFKWLLFGKLKPINIQLDSLLYIQKWIVDTMIFISLYFSRAIYATLYLPLWLRTIGAKVGKRAEVSTLNHLMTDLLEIGNQSFLADSTSIGFSMIYLGTIYLKETQIGNRSFIGNIGVLLPGTKIGNDCLIGVLSTSPNINDEEIKKSSWLGSLQIFLPNRQESPQFLSKFTFNPHVICILQEARSSF